MKKIKLLLLVIVFMLTMLASCASAPMDGKGDFAGGMESAPSDGETEVDPEAPEENEKPSPIMPGQLTACAYDDNEHFAFWKSLITSSQEGSGIFSDYYSQFMFQTLNRIKITVPASVPTKVSLLSGQEVISSAHTDASGVAYIYAPSNETEYNICLEYYKEDSNEVVKYHDIITGDTDYNLTGISKKQDAIQIMFVIDTTGSMGDELEFVKAEVIDIMTQVEEAFPYTRLELSVMVYRDYGDNYVTKYSDFSTDFNKQKNFISNESASGGGDFEEAVHTALTEASEKQWSENAKTKLLFHIADAPSHNEDVSSWVKATKSLADKGVHIITVASSGIDKKTEYFFRSQSMITNGKYVYLTNDSGIGGDHLEATVEERPVVEYLNACLVRLIKGYHTGTFEEPIHWQQTVKDEPEYQQ